MSTAAGCAAGQATVGRSWVRRSRWGNPIGSPMAGEVTADPSGRVVVVHVAELARHGVEGDPGPDVVRWHDDTLPNRLSPKVTGGEFDVLILDEAQDLSETWVLAISQLVARQGRWCAFAEGHQDLFDADASLPDFSRSIMS